MNQQPTSSPAASRRSPARGRGARAGQAGQAGHAGMTLLEVMIVLAVVGGLFFVVRSGFRVLTKADLVEDANELTAVMRRTSQLAVERGEQHRLVLDLDAQSYAVEVCRGQAAIKRNEQLKADDDETKRAIERAKVRLEGLPGDAASADADDATRRAIALAGHHIADRTCAVATEGLSGDVTGKGWARKLRSPKGIKFKEVWVQHREDSVRKGQVAVYFFANGSSEKSVVELTDGSEVFSVLVFGLTGRVELRDGALRDVNEHMLKNVMGNKDTKREDQK